MKTNATGFHNEHGHIRERWLWLGTLLLALLLVGCLALAALNAGPGFGPPGRVTHLRLESAITNYPFCPPSVPCPISMVLNHHNWVVWVLRETRSAEGVDSAYRRVINIPLWY